MYPAPAMRCLCLGAPGAPSARRLAAVMALLALARIPSGAAPARPATAGAAAPAIASEGVTLRAETAFPGSVCLGDPVLVRVTYHNPTERGRFVSLGNSDWSLLHFTVCDEAGRTISVTRPERYPFADFFSGLLRLGPGQHAVRHEVLARWCRIERPGRYQVRAQMGESVDRRAEPSSAFSLKVVAADERRLDALCWDLYRGELPGDDPQARGTCREALQAVRHDAALPNWTRGLASTPTWNPAWSSGAWALPGRSA